MNRNSGNGSFSSNASANIGRSLFNRSHGLKTTFDAGYLIPVLVDEGLPGDTFNCRMNTLARLATPIHPIMDTMYLESFFFAVPYRLVWENWERFNGAQDNPADTTDYTIPEIIMGGLEWGIESLGDYLGLPTELPGLTHSALPFRAVNLIWNTWFKDENLQNRLAQETDDGPDIAALYQGPWRRGKRHDYFTSCLPWPQKGDAVSLPLGTTAPIIGIGWRDQTVLTSGTSYETDATGSTTYAKYGDVAGTNELRSEEDPNNLGFPNIRADLTNATAATINQIREAISIQHLFERDARGGTRYVELLRAHFGVTSSDQRLMRPEWLGGGSQKINVTPVQQTSSTDVTTPQGNLAAIGVSAGDSHSFTKSLTEHCIILGFVSVRAELTYQQGLHKMWTRSTRDDFYWPDFAHLGEQAVLNQEIYFQGTDGTPSEDIDVWGYQERFAEYRYKPSSITGKFRSTYGTSLDPWHLAQEFTSLPTLGATFIADTPPVDRVIAVPAEPHFLLDAWFNYTVARPMPTQGNPGLRRF